MATITGAQIVARALKQQGVEHMFGIVGIPVAGLDQDFGNPAGIHDGNAVCDIRHHSQVMGDEND